ncbi:MAG TPA: homocysteine S-methyltransferase family protein [Ignavibacteriaceae bacterium]|nr:homocysteine S-methyltransferase family protein [Ignavibacteriaceae bacterium]
MINSHFNPFSFSNKINRPLILDGSIGALLQKKGLVDKSPFWSTLANEKYPEEVINLHKIYIEAGTDIITTNTFRTNPTAFKFSGRILSDRYVRNAVKLVKQAVSTDSILIAGSNAPAEDCYQSKRTLTKKAIAENHKFHIDQLMDYGCDFILNETQSHFDEIKFIADYCNKNKIPFIMSFLFDEKLKLLDGNSLRKSIDYVLSKNPLAIGFNCITYEILMKALQKIKPDFNWGFYLNCSKGFITEKIYSEGLSLSDYSNVVKAALKYSPSFIGSCCGSTPAFTRQIKRVIDGSDKS